MKLNLFPLTIAKLKKISITFVVLFFVLSYIFVINTLGKEEVKVEEKQSKSENIIEEKPVRVTLNINGSPYFGFQTINKRMQNTQTILDLLEILRDDGFLTYERTFYTYGVEIDNINGFIPPENEKWSVFVSIENEKSISDLKNNVGLEQKYEELLNEALTNSIDISDHIGNINLVDGATYDIKLSEKPTRNATPQ